MCTIQLFKLLFRKAYSIFSERFKAYIPVEARRSWNDIIMAALRRRPELRISQQSWAQACSTMTREGAAVCLLITDRATLRQNDL